MHRGIIAAAIGLGMSAALSGCSLFAPQAADPKPVQTKEVPAVVDEVIAALAPLKGREEVPSTKEFFDTMLGAGYEAKQLEATIDASPLGNEVPSKMFGVKVKEGCVVGEIRSGDISAHLMKPNESTGTCLLGHVERPEGAPAPTGDERDEKAEDNGKGHMPGEDMNGRPSETPGGSGDSGSGGSGSEGGSSGDSGSGDGADSGEAPELGGG